MGSRVRYEVKMAGAVGVEEEVAIHHLNNCRSRDAASGKEPTVGNIG
jgi:hypothetical protein